MDSLILDYGGALDYGVPAGTYYSDPSGEIAALTAKIEAAEKSRDKYMNSMQVEMLAKLKAETTITEQAAQIEALEKCQAKFDDTIRKAQDGLRKACSMHNMLYLVEEVEAALTAIDAAILGDSHVR